MDELDVINGWKKRAFSAERKNRRIKKYIEEHFEKFRSDLVISYILNELLDIVEKGK